MALFKYFPSIQYIHCCSVKSLRDKKWRRTKNTAHLWYKDCNTIVSILLWLYVRRLLLCRYHRLLQLLTFFAVFFLLVCVGIWRDKFPMSIASLICVNVYWHCRLNSLTMRNGEGDCISNADGLQMNFIIRYTTTTKISNAL